MTWSDISDIFAEIEILLIGSLHRNLKSHEEWEKEEGFKWPAWQSLKLANIENFRRENRELMNRYKKVIGSETEKLLLEQFAEGKGETQDGVTETSFFGINRRRNEALISDILNLEENAQTAALRMMDDVYRQTVYKAHLAMSSGAVTLPQAIDMATKSFLEKGIDCIVYKDGSRHNIADYVQMALRTAATRSYLQGEAEKRMELGIDTVIVSQYGACSETCLPWQGKVYIDDVFMPFSGEQIGNKGKSVNGKWYTLLSVAVKAGLFHPNCRHTLSTWDEGMSSLPKPLDKNKIRENSKLEAKQRELEREVRKWKRLAEGTQEEWQRKAYQKKVREAQKNLREFIAEHEDVLRRDYWREKVYTLKEKPSLSDESRMKEKAVKEDVSQLPENKSAQLKEKNADVQHNPSDEITDEDIYALNTYKSAESYKINDLLRRGEPLSPQEKEIIGNIERAIAKLPVYKGEVYRSLESDMMTDLERFNQEHIPGRIVSYQAFTSTGTIVYDESMDIQLIIESKTGRDMRKYNPMEQEILFPRGSRFLITKREGNKIWMKEI